MARSRFALIAVGLAMLSAGCAGFSTAQSDDCSVLAVDTAAVSKTCETGDQLKVTLLAPEEAPAVARKLSVVAAAPTSDHGAWQSQTAYASGQAISDDDIALSLNNHYDSIARLRAELEQSNAELRRMIAQLDLRLAALAPR